MEIHTVCLYKRDKADVRGIPVLDTTIKSGDITFAPTWSMVMDYKASDRGEDAERTYKEQYEFTMSLTRKAWSARWKEVMRMEKVALGCYCHAGKFCHRLLLVDMFKRLGELNGIDVVYKGELG